MYHVYLLHLKLSLFHYFFHFRGWWTFSNRYKSGRLIFSCKISRVNSRSETLRSASRFRSSFRIDFHRLAEAVGIELWRDESIETRKPLERDTNFWDKRRSVAIYHRAWSTTVAVKRNEMNDVALSSRAYRDLTDPVWLMNPSDSTEKYYSKRLSSKFYQDSVKTIEIDSIITDSMEINRKLILWWLHISREFFTFHRRRYLRNRS